IQDSHLIIEEHKIAIAKSYKDCLINCIDKLLL
ncbi:transcriptional regulator, partial [Flavobacterium columnare]